MAQNNIRSYGGVQYTIAEGSALVDELNNRTKSNVSDYDNLQKVGDKLSTMSIDTALSITSTNSVQNKVIKQSLDTKISDAPNDGKLYIRKSNTWNELTPYYTIEGTYAQIKALKDGNNLVAGVRYIITDYKTEYFVPNTNSSDKIKYKTTSASVSGWAILDNNYEYELSNGATVTITELPSGYSGSLAVGQTTTVSSINASYYFKFANGMQNTIGVSFSFNVTRFSGVAHNAVINDANGKPVMKPNGIINTDIHDGTVYCDMTAAENKTVPTERLVITASTNNSFEVVGYSDTYSGDVIHYDFDDVNIINDNKVNIGTRKGYIIRRINEKLKIDTKLDWRVIRFRRWLIDSDSRKQLINQDLDNTTRVGFGGNYLFTSQNRVITNTDHFYVARMPEQKFNNIDANAKRKTFTSVLESNIKCKDFNLFPLDDSYNPINVDKFELDAIWDSVCIGLSGEFSYKINIKGTTLQNTTFVSNPIISGNNLYILDSTMLDSFAIDYSINSVISNLVCLSYTTIGYISNTTIYDSIFGTHKGGHISGIPSPIPAAKWFILRSLNNTRLDNIVLGQASTNIHMIDSNLVDSSIFLYYSPIAGNSRTTEDVRINGSTFRNVYLRVPRNLYRVSFNDLFFDDSNPDSSDGLFIYETDVVPGILSNVSVKKNEANNNLYYTTVDASNVVTYVDIVTPTLTP